MKHTPLLFPLAVFLTVASPVAAQEGLDVGFEGLVEVSEVLLDVLATDADGNVVTGLTKDDFVIEEDGQPVEVTGASYYTTRYDEGGAAQQAREVPWSRYLIFFFDDQTRFGRYGNRLILQQLKASQQSQRWVEEEMLPSDWVAVARYDGELTVYHDFTQDRAALNEALQRAATGKSPANFAAPSRRQGTVTDLSILRRLPPIAGADRRETIYESLGRLATATGYVVGRKNLLLFTIGFGEEDYRRGTSEPDPELYPQLETLLNDHNVAVYPIDITPPGRQATNSDFLDLLAADTGGEYHEDFVGFLNPLKDVADANYGYYLLSYQSPRPAGEIGYQRVEVRARNPEIEVRARRGYRYGL